MGGRTIAVECYLCGRTLRAPIEAVGRSGRCAKCGATNLIRPPLAEVVEEAPEAPKARKVPIAWAAAAIFLTPVIGVLTIASVLVLPGWLEARSDDQPIAAKKPAAAPDVGLVESRELEFFAAALVAERTKWEVGTKQVGRFLWQQVQWGEPLGNKRVGRGSVEWATLDEAVHYVKISVWNYPGVHNYRMPQWQLREELRYFIELIRLVDPTWDERDIQGWLVAGLPDDPFSDSNFRVTTIRQRHRITLSRMLIVRGFEVRIRSAYAVRAIGRGELTIFGPNYDP